MSTGSNEGPLSGGLRDFQGVPNDVLPVSIAVVAIQKAAFWLGGRDRKEQCDMRRGRRRSPICFHNSAPRLENRLIMAQAGCDSLSSRARIPSQRSLPARPAIARLSATIVSGSSTYNAHTKPRSWSSPYPGHSCRRMEWLQSRLADDKRLRCLRRPTTPDAATAGNQALIPHGTNPVQHTASVPSS